MALRLHSIRARLTLSHLVVIVVAMALSGFLLLSLLERYFLQAAENSLLAQARITAQAVLPGADGQTPGADVPSAAFNTLQQRNSNLALQAQNAAPLPSVSPSDRLDIGYLENASLQLSTQLDTRIRILDATGKVLLDSLRQELGSSLQADALVARALTGEQGSETRGSGRGAIMNLALPVEVGDRLLGVVYLSQPLRDVDAVLSDLRIRWLISTFTALCLAGGVGLILSGAITRPLRRLTAAAGQVAAGAFDEQVPVASGDELGRLSRAFNDMTARLRTSRQAQVDFVANVSHELRTPLTVVKGLVETLRDGAVHDDTVRDRFLDTVQGETDRMIRLINDLLVLSRADSGALHLRLQALDLRPLAVAAVERFTPHAKKKALSLRVEASADVPWAEADPDRIEQVVSNLLDNAVKYSRPNGTITLSVERGQGETVLLRVRDEGVGIAAEDLARIGERFYRADRARSRSEGGSGLGLAIAHALVEAHGGELIVESREGHGTTVSVALPCAERARQSA